MQGSLTQQSSREKPQSLRPEVQDKLPVLDGHAITDERVIENTFINQTSVNEDAFRDHQNLIAGFPEGRIIVVTYFSQNKPITNMQSNVVDMTSTTKDDVHVSWTQIRNFELRCSNELSFEYDQESNKSKVNGDAILFPRFTPRVSDIFLYEMRNGQIGVFRVASVNRLALGQDTYHRITFTMQEYLRADYRDTLQRQTTNTMYFDKYKYLVGNTAMLSTDGYQQKKDLEHIRLEIIEDYIERFYSRDYSTFMRPDGIYDPYIVEYWNKKVSVQDTTPHMRPTQILISVSNFRKTIWAILTNNPIKNLANVERSWNTDTYHSTFWGVNITSLLGKKFITIGDEADANNSYSVNSKGEPILLDSLPTFHKQIPDEVIEERIEKDFYKVRKQIYKDLPNKKCPPHAHGSNVSFPGLFYPDQCAACEFDREISAPFPTPPFPIVSSDELAKIWAAIFKKDINYIPDEDDQAKIRGYIQWYRNEYPGTYSKVELKKMWLEEAKLPEDTEMTPALTTIFEEYVKSYRKQYLAVLTDRQIEYKWRMDKQVDGSLDLTKEQIADLVLTIIEYRRNHGFPDENSHKVIGTAVLSAELGAVQYSQSVVLDPPELMELNTLLNVNPLENVEVDILKNVPRVFYPRKHRHNAHHYHHSVCHYMCGENAAKRDKAKKAQEELDEKANYALSANFYNGSGAMDPFEQIVYDFITNKEVAPIRALEAVSRYKEWGDEDAFYRHLFSLYIIDKTLYWLMYH